MPRTGWWLCCMASSGDPGSFYIINLLFHEVLLSSAWSELASITHQYCGKGIEKWNKSERVSISFLRMRLRSWI